MRVLLANIKRREKEIKKIERDLNNKDKKMHERSRKEAEQYLARQKKYLERDKAETAAFRNSLPDDLQEFVNHCYLGQDLTDGYRADLGASYGEDCRKALERADKKWHEDC